MMDLGTGKGGGKWVCPNDRQLALRAKLRTGWSVKTQELQEYGRRPQSLNESEQNAIKQVIQRAEQLDLREQERVGRLVDRLDNMKRNVLGNGTTQCILCGDGFGIFGASNFTCSDCKKLVCEKCGVEIVSSSSQDATWLCKICSETREMWKKSGAWFFKGLPKYKLPEKKADKYGGRKALRPGLAKNNWSKVSVEAAGSSNGDLGKDEDDTSEDEDEKKVGAKEAEEAVRVPQSTLNVVHAEKAPRSPGTMSTVSGSLFFNTSSDSGVGDSERNPGTDKPSEGYRREVSNEESSDSTFSRQTSSTFSESQPNLTSSSTAYLSSCERLSPNRSEPASLNCDRSPPIDERAAASRGARKLPVPGCKTAKSDEGKQRKKVSIDFGKAAAAFLRHPLKGDRKKDGNKSADSDAWRRCGRSGNEHRRESRQEDARSDLGANHWMSQESGMDVTGSLSDLNFQSKWRESMSSLSRDYYWTEDRISLSSSSSLTPYADAADVQRSQNAQLGVLELTLLYEPARKNLNCTVHRARGLRGTDAIGLADPYCKLSIIPTTAKGGYLRTRTVHRTVNPEFDGSFNFFSVTNADMQRKVLRVSVLDDNDKCRDCFLGEARIALYKIDNNQPRTMKVQLEKSYEVDEDEASWEGEEEEEDDGRWTRNKY